MITYRYRMLQSPCIGHEGLGRVDPADGVRKCIAEECLMYRVATTYFGDITAAADQSPEDTAAWKAASDAYKASKTPETDKHLTEFVDSMWKKYTLGGCALAGHSNEEYKRYEVGQMYADS